MSKLNMFFSFLFVLIFSLACSFPQNPNIHSRVHQQRPAEKVITFISPDMAAEDVMKVTNAIISWQYAVNKSNVVEILDPIPGNITDIDNYTNLCITGNEKLVFIMDSKDTEYIKTMNLFFGGILAYTEHLGKYQNCKIESIQFFDIDEINETHDLDINFYLVAIHEFGHALGLEHIKQKKSIMYAEYEYGLTFLTQYDIDEFCRIFKCSIEEKNKIAYMHVPEEPISEQNPTNDPSKK